MKPRENTVAPSAAFQLPQNINFVPNYRISPQLLQAIQQANLGVDDGAAEAEAAEKKKKTRNIIIGSVVGVLLLGGGIALVVKSKK